MDIELKDVLNVIIFMIFLAVTAYILFVVCANPKEMTKKSEQK